MGFLLFGPVGLRSFTGPQGLTSDSTVRIYPAGSVVTMGLRGESTVFCQRHGASRQLDGDAFSRQVPLLVLRHGGSIAIKGTYQESLPHPSRSVTFGVVLYC